MPRTGRDPETEIREVGEPDGPDVVPQRLRPQPPRAGQLERHDLVERLRKADVPIVVLRAGAGYGKSTVLSQLAAADRRPVGWLTCDPTDHDPVVFARHLVQALIDAGLDLDGARRHLAGATPQVERRTIPAVAAALDRAAAPFLLVVDDVHELDGTRSRDLLEQVLRCVPDGSTTAVGGRWIPELGLARRVVDDEVVQLDERDLAFRPDEGLEVVRTALPGLPSRVADDLLRLTELWPAGVHLGILALRDHPDPPVVIDGLVLSDRRVVDYLQAEVLDRLAPDTRRFLTDVCVVEQLSGGVCDAVTGGTDGARRLEALVASGNLFVTAAPGAGGRFRLHPLFAEQLLGELRRTAPEREPELRCRAARWLDDHGEADEAVRQALLGHDRELATRIVFRHHSTMVLRGGTATLERWVASFPGDAVASDGRLALSAGWSAILNGDRTAAEHHLRDAQRLEVAGPLPDGARYDVAVAALAMLSGFDGVLGTIRSAEVVVAAGPDANPWWVLARSQWAVASVLAGTVDPIAALTDAELDTRGSPSVHAVTTAQLAIARLRAGDHKGADALARAAVEEASQHELASYGLIGVVHCAASRCAAALDPVRSRRHAADAEVVLALTEHLVRRAGVQFRQLLAEAALVRGEPGVAARLLPIARRLLAEEPDAAVLLELQDELERRLAQARRHPELQELTAAELRVLAQLATHRSLVEIGEHLYVSRNTVKTHTLSIYRKLGVSGRSQAVERARELELLERDPEPRPS